MSVDEPNGDSYTYVGSDGVTMQTVRVGDLVNVHELDAGPQRIIDHGLIDAFANRGVYVDAHYYDLGKHGLELVVEQPYRITADDVAGAFGFTAAELGLGRPAEHTGRARLDELQADLERAAGRAFLDAALAGRNIGRVRAAFAWLLLLATAIALAIVVGGAAYWYLSTINDWANNG